MQQYPQVQEVAPQRRGCTTWIAVAALVLASINLLVNIIQESEWNRRVEQATGSAAPQQVAQAAAPVDTSVPTPAPTTAAQSVPVAAGLQYADVCGIDESKMTEVQLTQAAQSFTGREFANWQGFVYDVQPQDGAHIVQLAEGPRGLLWGRDMVLYGVPSEVAIPLNVEQRVIFSGKIREAEVGFGVICNPITIDVTSFAPQ